jgi:hypothetical protein
VWQVSGKAYKKIHLEIKLIPVVTLSHSGDGLKKPRNIQKILLVMTLMENSCQAYNLTILLIALVSIYVHGFESVITFIVYILKYRLSSFMTYHRFVT